MKTKIPFSRADANKVKSAIGILRGRKGRDTKPKFVRWPRQYFTAHEIALLNGCAPFVVCDLHWIKAPWIVEIQVKHEPREIVNPVAHESGRV